MLFSFCRLVSAYMFLATYFVSFNHIDNYILQQFFLQLVMLVYKINWYKQMKFFSASTETMLTRMNDKADGKSL